MLPGIQAEIRSRSGLALKQGIMVLNSPGTIDSDYPGEIGVILFNTTAGDFYVNAGDRIAQVVFMPALRAAFSPLDQVRETERKTERSSEGFGSTGVAGWKDKEV